LKSMRSAPPAMAISASASLATLVRKRVIAVPSD
jgi:hypothetical protein